MANRDIEQIFNSKISTSIKILEYLVNGEHKAGDIKSKLKSETAIHESLDFLHKYHLVEFRKGDSDKREKIYENTINGDRVYDMCTNLIKYIEFSQKIPSVQQSKEGILQLIKTTTIIDPVDISISPNKCVLITREKFDNNYHSVITGILKVTLSQEHNLIFLKNIGPEKEGDLWQTTFEYSFE